MKTFESNILNIYGDKGQKWLSDLPYLINDFTLRWHLSGLKPVDNLSYNYVLQGFQGAHPVILKLGHDIKGLHREGAALKTFEDYGAVKVLSQANGALLLERATPGYSLKQFFPNRDDEAVTIASEVIRKLHKMPKINLKGFPTINDWLTGLDTNHEILGQHLPKSRALGDKLLNTMNHSTLLHGDLHHDNILATGNEWKIIDPKGVIGEPAYEVGCFIRNPIQNLPSHPDCLKIIMNRVDSFSRQLNFDADRILKWCFIQTVLAAVWAVEDNINPTNFMDHVAIFDKLAAQ